MAENLKVPLPCIHVLLCICSAPAHVDEFALMLPAGTTVAEALQMAVSQGIPLATHGKSGASLSDQSNHHAQRNYGVWGRIVSLDTVLRDEDRLELYRPLLVDPKHARRERFNRQGSRGAGLFEKRRAGAKAGY